MNVEIILRRHVYLRVVVHAEDGADLREVAKRVDRALARSGGDEVTADYETGEEEGPFLESMEGRPTLDDAEFSIADDGLVLLVEPIKATGDLPPVQPEPIDDIPF